MHKILKCAKRRKEVAVQLFKSKFAFASKCNNKIYNTIFF
jgi:hypothetical protein